MSEQETPEVKLEPFYSSVPPPPPSNPEPVVEPVIELNDGNETLETSWNWGAFLLTPVWLGAMHLWWYLLINTSLLIFLILSILLQPSAVGVIAVILIMFTLITARQGYTLARKSRRWHDRAHILTVQRSWRNAAFIIWGFILVCFMILMILFVLSWHPQE